MILIAFCAGNHLFAMGVSFFCFYNVKNHEFFFLPQAMTKDFDMVVTLYP